MSSSNRITLLASLLGATALTLAAPGAYAVECDLTVINSTCTISSAIYTNPDNTTTVGSGVIDPFLTTQAAPPVPGTGYESGYSTDADAPLPLDDKRTGSDQFTRTFSLSQTGFFTISGTQYYGFFLDINEPNGGDASLISLDFLKIYDTNQTGDVLLNTSDLAALDAQGWDLVYNLGANNVLLDYDLFNGSGNGYDMELLIPVSTFDGVALDARLVFATAYSGASDGFEEWAHLAGTGVEVCPPGTIGTPPFCVLPPVVIPEPGGLALLGLGLAGLVAIRRRRLPV